MQFLYKIYQLLVALPLGLVFTFIAALITIIGCLLGNAQSVLDQLAQANINSLKAKFS